MQSEAFSPSRQRERRMSHFSLLGDDIRTLSVLFLSSSMKTFIMTISPVESVWQAISFLEPFTEDGVMEDCL